MVFDIQNFCRIPKLDRNFISIHLKKISETITLPKQTYSTKIFSTLTKIFTELILLNNCLLMITSKYSISFRRFRCLNERNIWKHAFTEITLVHTTKSYIVITEIKIVFVPFHFLTYHNQSLLKMFKEKSSVFKPNNFSWKEIHYLNYLIQITY